MSPTPPASRAPAGAPASAPATTTATAASICSSTSFGDNVLYRNLGGARFENVTARAGLPTGGRRWGSGCAMLDYDRDGRLDLFVANYLAFDSERAREPGQGVNCLWKGMPVNCGPKGLPTDTNLLFHNEGDGTFRDVSAASGMATITRRLPDDRRRHRPRRRRLARHLRRVGFDGRAFCTATTATARSPTWPSRAARPSAIRAWRRRAWGSPLATGTRRCARPPQDAFRRRRPRALPRPREGPVRGRGHGGGLGVRNRFVQWGGGLPDLDNDGWPDPAGRHRQRLSRRSSACSPSIRIAARASCSGTCGGERLRGRHRAIGAGHRCVALEPRRRIRRLRQRRRPRRARHEHERAAVAAAQRSAQRAHWLQVRLRRRRQHIRALAPSSRVTSGGRTQARAVLSQSQLLLAWTTCARTSAWARGDGRPRRGAVAERALSGSPCRRSIASSTCASERGRPSTRYLVRSSATG